MTKKTTTKKPVKKTTKTVKKTTKKAGRATTYTKEKGELAVTLRERGYLIDAICKELKIHRDTLYQWRKKDPIFADAFALAATFHVESQEQDLVNYSKNIVQQMKMGEIIEPTQLNAHRLYIDTMKWKIQRTGRRYGVKGESNSTNVEVENSEDNEVKVIVSLNNE